MLQYIKNNPEIFQPESIALKDYHRMEKAYRSGIEKIMAYRLNPKQHITFLTTQKAYYAYIEYWNDKLQDL